MEPGDQTPEDPDGQGGPDGPDGGPEPEPGLVLATGTLVYGAMGAAALLWLWARDR